MLTKYSLKFLTATSKSSSLTKSSTFGSYYFSSMFPLKLVIFIPLSSRLLWLAEMTMPRCFSGCVLLRMATRTPTLKAICMWKQIRKACSLRDLWSRLYRRLLFSGFCRNLHEVVCLFRWDSCQRYLVLINFIIVDMSWGDYPIKIQSNFTNLYSFCWN